MDDHSLSRREFLIGATAATAAAWLSAQEIFAQDTTAVAPSGPAVACGVIGLGLRGKELLATLARFPSASIAAICDNYEPALTRGKESAPNAAALTDYQRLLDKKEVEAVFIATPSHLHKEIALAAALSGKSVYIEAPMAVTIDDCREIAKAGLACKQLFQVGQQLRSSPLRKHVLAFVKTGALGAIAQTRAQWHKKTSWRRAASTPEREKELNWKLSSSTCAGLIGEVGLHQVDLISWYLDRTPVSVTGFGGILQWKDGRDVADTVQCVLEYPGGVRLVYDATLANSFDGAYELALGSDSAILMRGVRAWMVREADSPMLGWEVYATKEKVGDESGIVLTADATKHIEEKLGGGGEGGEAAKQPAADTARDDLYYAVEEFLTNARGGGKPSCGALEGYRAAVTAIKANEAITSGSKIAYQKEWFELA